LSPTFCSHRPCPSSVQSGASEKATFKRGAIAQEESVVVNLKL